VHSAGSSEGNSFRLKFLCTKIATVGTQDMMWRELLPVSLHDVVSLDSFISVGKLAE
jgi:hypothetical protein